MSQSILKPKSPYLYGAAGIVLGIVVSWFVFGGVSAEHMHDGAPDTAATQEEEEPTWWTCSMHPQIRQPAPGQCPICGMDLIPVAGAGDDGGPRRLEMSEAAKKLAEIEVAPVERRLVEHETRMVGKIEYDETRTKYITAWFPGRLERLFVDFTGTPVKKGDHLVEIYSPQILTDQKSLLEAYRSVHSSPPSSDPNAQKNRVQVLEKARERLRLLGLTQEQVEEIETSGTPSERIVFYSPIDGIVIHKTAFEGDYVQTGMRIYTIADLNHVWVKMDAYESDLEWIRYGQDVEFTTVAHPGEVFHGRVAFEDPFLNEMTRTVKVRVNVENSEGKLKPEMFVNAIVRSTVTQSGAALDPDLEGKWMCPMHPEIVRDEAGFCDLCKMPLVTTESLGFGGPTEEDRLPPLVVPAPSVLKTGKRAVVYVAVPDTERPTFEGREVVVGARAGDYYLIESGLQEGEMVVVNGNFKIDSALQIAAKPSMMSPEGGPAPAHAHSGTSLSGMAPVPAPQQETAILPAAALRTLIPHYLNLAAKLASDDLGGAQQAAGVLAGAVDSQSAPEFSRLAHNTHGSQTIETTRENFSLLSDAMIRSLESDSAPDETLYVLRCPMAFGGRGAHWIQRDRETRNPYFGAAMLKCGSIVKELTAAGN